MHVVRSVVLVTVEQVRSPAWFNSGEEGASERSDVRCAI